MLPLMEMNDEKRDILLNAGFSSFAMGYKKGSIQDIAGSANISKSLVFYYFITKKELYLTLYRHALTLVQNEMDCPAAKNETDIFERLRIVQSAKFGIVKKYPRIFDFLKAAYFEKDVNVADGIKASYSSASAMGNMLSDIDMSRFKEEVNLSMVIDIISWCAEGYVASVRTVANPDIQSLIEGFEQYLLLLKRNFYKEDYR